MEFNNSVNSLTAAEYIQIQIDDFLKSPQRRMMEDGERYYRVENTAVKSRKMIRYENETAVVDETKPNNRLAHGFMNTLVDDKVNYLLTKPFTMSCENEDYLNKVKDLLGKTFQKYFVKLGTDASNKGISWLHPYINPDGEFKIKAVAGEQGVPAWRDDDHEVLDNFIWFYPVEMWEGKTKRTVVKAQFWTADGVSYWVKDGEYSQTFILDSEMYLEEDLLVGEDNLQQHFMLGSEAGSWGAVPFIAFKNNEYEMSDLQRVKSLIDNYDFSRSDVANTLEEIKSVVYGLRGYGGTDLSEFMRDLAYYRAVKLDSDGGLETYNPSIDINAAKEHYDALKKDIFTFGQGVDKDSDRLGSSPSGVALKFMYSGLDLKCNKLESCFNDGFDNLLYFINRYFEVTGQGGETADIDLIFNRDIAINESQAITDCRNSAGIISDETIIANHPWTKDVKEEMQRLEAQKQTAEEDYSGFGGIEENKEETEEE